MALRFSFPMGLLLSPSARLHPENVVRQVLEANSDTLTMAITAGSITVSIAPNGHGIEMLDACSGVVRFVIGGRPDLIEKARFSLDWGHRILALEMTEGSDELGQPAAHSTL